MILLLSFYSKARHKIQKILSIFNIKGASDAYYSLRQGYRCVHRRNIEKYPNGLNWLWAWALAIPKTSKSPEAAERFIAWATSKEYIQLVADQNGWVAVPPGTRTSTYENPNYQTAAPFAPIVLRSIQSADITQPAAQPTPYKGVQYVNIPEFQAIGSSVGQTIAAALTNNTSVDQALQQSQRANGTVYETYGVISSKSHWS